MHEHCGFIKVDLRIRGNRYRSLPRSVKAGRASLLVHNDDATEHPLVLFQVNDAVGDDPATLVTNLAALESKGTLVATVVVKGGSAWGVVANLPPGRFLYFDGVDPDRLHGEFRSR